MSSGIILFSALIADGSGDDDEHDDHIVVH